MKRTIILFFAILGIGVSLFAQARLGSTSAAIRSEFAASEYHLKSGYLEDGTLYITIEVARASVIYYFNKNLFCIMTLIAPDDQGALNYYVELYNKTYVVISAKQWRAYLEEGIADIELVYPDGGGFYFIWTDHK